MGRSKSTKSSRQFTGTGEKAEDGEQQVEQVIPAALEATEIPSELAQVGIVAPQNVREKPGPKPGSKNEKSIANLTQHTGRTAVYGVRKGSRTISITDEAWNLLQGMCKQRGVSVSELLEQIARAKVLLCDPKPNASSEAILHDELRS
jgi:hypothetical protein